MVKEKKRLPVGLENFEQIINDNYYYVDKTGLDVYKRQDYIL